MNLSLTLPELLYKDYKKFHSIGYAVIFVRLSDLLCKLNEESIREQFKGFQIVENISTLIVFFVYLENQEI